MPYTNHFIEKVIAHPHILTEESVIYSHRSHWLNTSPWASRLMVEIGTGMGNFFTTYADTHRDTACIGIEIKYKRLYRTYEKCAAIGREDVVLLRVMWQKISEIFDSQEVDELYLLFSDPWPKKAHHKHRVIQPDFLSDAAWVLTDHGIFVIKTDDEAYSSWIQEQLISSGIWSYIMTIDEDPEKRPTIKNATEFETKWRTLGKKITSFICTKKL
jgi:tRNA (guanine-N7-)-methyltransferase